jgi:hypothetical protein
VDGRYLWLHLQGCFNKKLWDDKEEKDNN